MIFNGGPAAISYGAAKLWAIPIALVALAVVGGLVYLTGWAITKRKPRTQRPPLSLLFGADNRLSTSKTIAAAWTAVVLYILVVLLLAWPSDWDKALANLSPTYLLLLGGPYASLVLSKGIVTAKTNGGSLQKTSGDGVPRISDLVSDDDGQTDLFDVQYVLFNVSAMAYVIDAFVRASLGSGLPSIPEGLVALTGGPAAVYLANKALSSNPPTITVVTPTVALPGAELSIIGQNLAPLQLKGVDAASVAEEDRPTVQIGGQAADVVWIANDRITATLPVPIAPVNGALDVAVVTTAKQTCSLPAALTIAPPLLVGVDQPVVTGGDTVTASGRWSSTDSIKPTVLIDGVTVPSADDKRYPGMALEFTVPELGGPERPLGVWLVLGAQSSDHVTVQLHP